jgi:serralysin
MGNTLGVVSGTDAGLEALEPGFHQDLNGDLTIGPTVSTTVIEAFGSTSLTQVGNNYFLYANGTTTGPELKYQGAPVMAGGFGAGWTPIGGEQTSSGYEVAWKDASTGQFTTWNTDSDGNYIANAIGVVSSADPSLQALEPSFHQNLNGDGLIGLAGAGGFTLSSAGGGTVVVVGGATVQSGDLLEAGTSGSFTGDLTNHAVLVHAIAANLTNSASVSAVGQVSTAASTQPELIMAAAVQTGH